MKNNISNISNITFISNSPHLFALFPKEVKGFFSWKEKIKYLLRMVVSYSGAKNYYAINNGVIGYCFLKKNWFGKYPFMRKEDLLVNPYYVVQEYRGKGIASLMMKEIVRKESHGVNLWAVVKIENIPSLKVLRKVGFEDVGYVAEGWKHDYVDKSSLVLLKYAC